MFEFHYKAVDDKGESVEGEIFSPTEEAALRTLQQRGLHSATLVRRDDFEALDGDAESLSTRESEELTAYVAEIVGSELPLGDGFRAAATEAGNGRLRRAMDLIANRLDRGEPLDRVLASGSNFIPQHLSGLVAVAARTQNMVPALSDLIAQQYATRELKRTVRSSLAYPAFVLLLAAALFLLASIFILPMFVDIFEEFEMSLPTLTTALIVVGKYGAWMLVVGVPCLLVALFIVRLFVGPARWVQFVARLPLLGRLVHWTGVAEFTRLLGLLVEYQVPIPEALRYTSDGVQNADVAQVCDRLAFGIAQGRTLADVMAEIRRFPATLEAFVRWGEQTGTLADALASATEMFEDSVRIQASMFKVIFPPFVFLIVLVGMSFLVIGLLLPLINLVSDLSY